jgi:hypothetical protein
MVLADGEQHNDADQEGNETEHGAHELVGLPVHGVEGFEVQDLQVCSILEVLGQQRVEARAGGRDLPGVTELHEDGGDLGRTGAEDQALGLGQMHGHIHVVEGLDAHVVGFDHIEAGHIGGAPRGGRRASRCGSRPPAAGWPSPRR